MAYRWKGTSSFDDEPLWLLQDRAGTVGAQRPPCHLPPATGTGIPLPWVKLLTAETETFSQQKEITRALKIGASKVADPCAQMCGTALLTWGGHFGRTNIKKYRKVEKGKKVTNLILIIFDIRMHSYCILFLFLWEECTAYVLAQLMVQLLQVYRRSHETTLGNTYKPCCTSVWGWSNEGHVRSMAPFFLQPAHSFSFKCGLQFHNERTILEALCLPRK